MFLKGVIIPVTTPVDEGERIDVKSGKRLLEYLVGAGVHGLFLFGTSGLYGCFDGSERFDWISAAVETARARKIPVLVGIQGVASRQVESLARQAEEAGADAVVLLPPHPLPVRRRSDVLRFFRAAMEATRLPLVIYNNPSLGHAKLDLDLIEEIADSGRVIGIKDTSYDFFFFRNLILRFARRAGFSILQGAIPYSDVSLYAGAHGLVPGTGALAPALWVSLYEASTHGRWDEARSIQERLIRLNRIYGEGGADWPSGLHFALSALGLCSDHVPRPYEPLREEARAPVVQYMVEAGLSVRDEVVRRYAPSVRSPKTGA